jgi:hypothetical protein
MVVVGVMRFVAGSAHAVLLIAKVAVGEDGTDAHSASNTSLSTGARCAKSSLNPLDESGVTVTTRLPGVSEVRGKYSNVGFSRTCARLPKCSLANATSTFRRFPVAHLCPDAHRFHMRTAGWRFDRAEQASYKTGQPENFRALQLQGDLDNKCVELPGPACPSLRRGKTAHSCPKILLSRMLDHTKLLRANENVMRLHETYVMCITEGYIRIQGLDFGLPQILPCLRGRTRYGEL